ncbi:thiosulfate sulfurtransferase isoform X2 [Triticum aestivum]|uniref:thiosulfate sulfurtransferase isoform X2 n=1 Tax=Triticum aestivum TaxID=4565 RepID=UPI001D01B38D|nr:thiosulfate sulfurtransferase-like isoform X2 [Triticum aestivum]
MVAAPAPALTAADARQAAARKEEEDDEEVVCFICFDGGDLVVCDWRCDAAVRDFFHAWMVIERAPPDCSQCRRRLQAAESRSFPPVRFLSLPHMLPSEKAFYAAVSSLGIYSKDVYDGKGLFSAARVWWMFRAYGHDKVWVLDGGLPQWRASGYGVESSASSDAILKASAASEAIEKVYQGQSDMDRGDYFELSLGKKDLDRSKKYIQTLQLIFFQS